MCNKSTVVEAVGEVGIACSVCGGFSMCNRFSGFSECIYRCGKVTCSSSVC